jgi:CheY-like chemotaxis protein
MKNGGTPQPPTVLIVDDFEDNRAMYAEYLNHAGYRVIEAANGLEAVEKAHEARPDIVVMDLSLPVMDGWEATRRLKQDPDTQSIPIVALTGHALAGHSRGAKEAGCDDFLAKPCLPKTLLDKIQSMLSNRSARLPEARKAKESPGWPTNAKGQPSSARNKAPRKPHR